MFTCLWDLRCEQCASCSLLAHHGLTRDLTLPFHQQTSRGAAPTEMLTQQFPAPVGKDAGSWRTSKRRGLKQQSIISNSTLSLTQCSDRKWKHHSCHMVDLWYSDFCNCYLKDLCYASQTYCNALLAQKCSWHKKFGFACDFIQLLRNNSESSTSSTGCSTWTAATGQVLNTAEII